MNAVSANFMATMWPPLRKDSARTTSADAQPMGSVFKLLALGGNESVYDAVPQLKRRAVSALDLSARCLARP